MSICAVVVTYKPDLNALGRLLDALVPQVTSIVIVDNGSDVDLDAWNKARQSNVDELLLLGENKGIAAAHNVGIQWARNHRAGFVLLMDQDSVPLHDMVEKLVTAMPEQLSPVVVGPRYLDERQGYAPPFFRIRGLTRKRCACDTENSVVPVDYLISSGCLIPMAVLDKVGGMKDGLFIDYVDIEWGLRARHCGIQSYGVCSAHMQHSLGERTIKLLGKNIILHDPIRHYYQFRNAVLLYKEPWIPLNWKLLDGWSLCLRYVCYPLFAKPRMVHWRMMTLGVWHGLAGKSGKFEGNIFSAPAI